MKSKVLSEVICSLAQRMYEEEAKNNEPANSDETKFDEGQDVVDADFEEVTDEKESHKKLIRNP